MKSYLIIALFFISPALLAQSRVDSLQNALATQTYDTAKVDVLLELSFFYRNSIPDSTLYYARQALALAEEIKYPRGHAQSLRNIGLGYTKLGKYDTAITLCQEAVKIGEAGGSQWAVNNAYNTIGIAHYYKGEYDESVEAFKKTLEGFKSLGNQEVEVAGALINIGSILENKGDYARALDYYQQALLAFEKLEHAYGIATVSNNMASIFEDQKDWQKAEKYYKQTAHYDSLTNNVSGYGGAISHLGGIKLSMGDTTGAFKDYYQAISLFKKAKADCNSSGSISDLGDLFLSTHQLDSAYHYIRQAVSIAKDCNNINDLIGATVAMGKYYNAVKNPTKAIQYFKQSYTLALKDTLRPAMATAANFLYKTYKEQNNIAQALHYLEINKKLEDELFNKENTRKITQLEGQYDLEKEKQTYDYEKQISTLKYQDEIAKEKLSQRLTLIALLVFIVLLVVIVIFYLQKRKINKEVTEQNNQIREQNEEIILQHDLLEERSKEVEEQKQALLTSNVELKDLNNEKNTIIGIVAHDLKSPLNQIRGLIELINIEMTQSSDLSLNADIQDYLDKLQAASNRSLQMIDRILDINAVENKGIEIKSEPLDLAQLLEEVKNDFQHETDAKDISLQLEVQPKIDPFSTDRLLFREVLENLLSNAVKYSPRKSEIILGLSQIEGLIKLYVTDQGPGISEEDQRMMYNKYQRASAEPTGQEKSTGLGLAIVKRYIDALGYRIICESVEGKGTTFIIEMKP